MLDVGCRILKIGLENGTRNNRVHPGLSVWKLEYFKIFIFFLEMTPDVKAYAPAIGTMSRYLGSTDKVWVLP